MKPMYYVNIAGVNLHNVENIHDENGREISTYDGVGSGKFNVPDSKSPHAWKFDCELWQDGHLLSGMNTWSASEIFKLLDSLLISTEPSRFVVTSQFFPVVNMSTLVWFKRRTRDESYPGVYKTTIEVEEYKPVGVKTTNIPYVARPGKLPVPSKVIITKKNTVYNTNKKYGLNVTANSINNAIKLGLANPKTGKPVTNPATVKNGTVLKAYPISGDGNMFPTVRSAPLKDQGNAYAGTGANWYDGTVKSVTSTFSWIANGISNFLKNPG